jgi:hypothetical protein
LKLIRKKNKLFWLFIFSIILLEIIDISTFDVLEKLNYSWQQYHIKFSNNVTEITISKQLYAQLKNDKNEIIFEGKFFDIKHIEFIDNETVRLFVKQDKFDSYIDMAKSFFKNQKNELLYNLKLNSYKFFPLWFINFERIHFEIPVLEFQKINYFDICQLTGFLKPLFHPPEFYKIS